MGQKEYGGRYTQQIIDDYRAAQSSAQTGEGTTYELFGQSALAHIERQRALQTQKASVYPETSAVGLLGGMSPGASGLSNELLLYTGHPAVPGQQTETSAQQKKSRRGRFVAIVTGIAVAAGGGFAYYKTHQTEEVDPAAAVAAEIKQVEMTPPSLTPANLHGCMKVAKLSMAGSGLINISINPYTKEAKPKLVKNAITQATTYMSIKGSIELCDPDPKAKDKKPLTEYDADDNTYVVNRGVLKAVFEPDPNEPMSCSNVSLDRETAKQYDCVEPPMTNIYVDNKVVKAPEVPKKYAFTDPEQKFLNDMQNIASSGYKKYREAVIAKFKNRGLEALNSKEAHLAFQQSVDKSLEQYILSQIDNEMARKRAAANMKFEGDYAMPAKDYAPTVQKLLDYKRAEVKDYAPTITVKPVVAQPQTGA